MKQKNLRKLKKIANFAKSSFTKYMINRSIIRGKVLQQLYAYEICKSANLELAKEAIITHFKPNLNTMEPQDPNRLEGLTKLTLLHFEEYNRTFIKNTNDDLPKEVLPCFERTLKNFNNDNSKDKLNILKILIQECEKIYNLYLFSLALLPKIGQILFEAKKIDTIKKNIFIQCIENHSELEQKIIKNQINLDESEIIYTSIITNLLNDEVYKMYVLAKSDSIDKEREFALYFLKTIVLKNESLLDFFDELDYNWSSNKVAIKDMAAGTIKAMKPNEQFELSPLSKNWDEDKVFLKSLFLTCIDNNRESEEFITPHLINWELGRLVTIDAILIKMCLTEMIEFPNIPTKVSINEYLDISKKYSSEKSSEFINGVLDKISKTLTESGKIKKSGRGLIDNR